MRNENYESERLRSVHLNMLVVITLSTIGMFVETFLMDWEYWYPPFLAVGTVISWYLHIKQIYTLRQRLYFYAFMFWAIAVYHGVHATSFFDLAPVAAIEFAMLAQADERRILRISLALFAFCFVWDLYQTLMDPTFVFTPLIISRLVLHICVVSFTYGIADDIIRKRRDDRANDEALLQEQKFLHKRTEDFMANVSHELRTPVNVVTGLSAVMLERETDEEVKADAAHILSAGRRLTAQVDDIMDYHEIETGELVIASEPFMIASVINDCLTALNVHERTNIPQIIVDVDAGIPVKLQGDARHIKKILYHIMDNAIKFTEQGGIYLNVYQVKRDYGINLCIEVEDTGIGMTREALERIRQGSYQEDASRSKEQGGFGLGFRIIYGLVHAMNGFVRIASTPKKGTTVHVSIPVGVLDNARCMDISNPERLKLAFYQDPSKFDVPALREYYTQFIRHVITAHDLTLQRVASFEDLKQLLMQNTFTHLFTADEEYTANPAYYDALSLEMHVIVVARQGFHPDADSRVTILRKPVNTFPLIEALNAGTEAEAKAVLYREEEVKFDGLKVLVVDDERMNLVVAKGIFSRYGMEVHLANSGAESIECVKNDHFDVIFMDHMMPGMDGVEAAKHIRAVLYDKDERSLLIALTANAVSGARGMFLENGFDGFVSKPIDHVELERTLRAVLKR